MPGRPDHIEVGPASGLAVDGWGAVMPVMVRNLGERIAAAIATRDEVSR